MPEWDAETTVDADLARRLIGEQFPELADAPISQIGAGWDNTVFRVADAWAFRFPRRPIAVPLIEKEALVLPRLAGHLPLPIPAPRFVGHPTDDFAWPWLGGPYVPGVELAEAALPDERREQAGAALGAFLRALHGPGVSRLVGADLPVDPMRRGDMGFRVPHARRRLDAAIDAGLWTSTPEVERLLTRAVGLPPPPRTRVLHGDLHARHILVEGERLTGVIDWGDVSAGDPSVDISIAYGALVGPARKAFLDAYGRVDSLTELRARVLATFLAGALLVYAADVGLEGLRLEALRALERVVS